METGSRAGPTDAAERSIEHLSIEHFNSASSRMPLGERANTEWAVISLAEFYGAERRLYAHVGYSIKSQS